MHIVRELCAESELAQVFNSQESLVACYSRWGGDRVLSAGGNASVMTWSIAKAY